MNKWNKAITLKFKILFTFFLTSILPIFFLSLLFYSVTKDVYLKSKMQALEMHFSDQLLTANSILQLYFDRIRSIILDSEIQRLMNQKSTPVNLLLLKKQLSEKFLQIQSARSLSLLDTSGMVLASTDASLEKISLAETAPYKKGLTGISVVSLYKDINNLILVKLSGPIYSGNKLVGVVILDLSFEDFLNLTHNYSDSGETGESYLVKRDTTGAILFLSPLRFDAEAALNKRIFIDSEDLLSAQALSGSNISIGVFKDYRNKEVFASSKFMPGVEWGLVSKIDKSEILIPLERLKNISIVLFFIVICFAILLFFYLSDAVLSPIRRMRDTVSKIIAGDLSQRVPVNVADELGQLALSFNDMTKQLQVSQETLENRVVEKTKELATKVEALERSEKATLNLLQDLDTARISIEKEKAKDEAFLASIGDGVVGLDDARRVVYMNKSAEDLLGVASSELIGKTWGDPFPQILTKDKKELPITSRSSYRVYVEKKVLTDDVVYVVKSGANIPFSVVSAPIIIGDKITGSVLAFRDVSLEREVDRMKTEFISLASHQLRTPLSAMNWFSEMLLAGDAGALNEEQKEFVRNIRESNDRMLALVNSLLNISRIESGRIATDPVKTNLLSLVDSIIKELKPKIDAKKQKIIVGENPNLPEVLVDATLIRQVYVNLLTNAIKYTQEGGIIKVLISCEGVACEAGIVLSQVIDNGYGIPEKDKAKIFDKFYRASNISSIETDGSGLGLYLVKAVVESSGGKIWFDSKEGEGTIFTFSLPINGKDSL